MNGDVYFSPSVAFLVAQETRLTVISEQLKGIIPTTSMGVPWEKSYSAGRCSLT